MIKSRKSSENKYRMPSTGRFTLDNLTHLAHNLSHLITYLLYRCRIPGSISAVRQPWRWENSCGSNRRCTARPGPKPDRVWREEVHSPAQTRRTHQLRGFPADLPGDQQVAHLWHGGRLHRRLTSFWQRWKWLYILRGAAASSDDAGYVCRMHFPEKAVRLLYTLLQKDQ